MSALSSILKKPKVEVDEEAVDIQNHNRGKSEEDEADTDREEQEEALVALIEHRSKEVDHLIKRITYYKSQLAESQTRLHDSKSKLARLRGKDNGVSSRSSQGSGSKRANEEHRLKLPDEASDGPAKSRPQPKTQLLIPGVAAKTSQPLRSEGFSARTLSSSGASPCNALAKVKVENSLRPLDAETRDRGMKRKIEQIEHKEVIRLIGRSSSPTTIDCYASNHMSSQHKRKLRSLVLCPVNEQLFVTSALDGLVNLWQIQSKGSTASLLSTTDCVSPKQRRWPEDIAWHPDGNSLVLVYTADAGDSQMSIVDLNKSKKNTRVTFLEDKPHVKGIINNVNFMPWEDTCFVTGGSDHGVILWNEGDAENSWKPKSLHRNLHSSAVMGVAGMNQKNIVLSVGADRKIFGFDVQAGRADFKHQIESKCMSVLPNPCDFNLFMVQTGQHEKQLRLFDIRLRQTELHSFGWKQQSSDSQSALINQSWSPDGLYISSGSADPIIHIFDIRYNAHKPSQSIRAHQKRVFKAEWHKSLPLLISISSDLNIGLHKLA